MIFSDFSHESCALNDVMPVPATATRMPSTRIEPAVAPAVTVILIRLLVRSTEGIPTVMPVAATFISESLVFVICNGDTLMTRLPPSAGPSRRLTMTDPITSVCPVAMTVVGMPDPVNNPCADNVPESVRTANAARPVNLNFMLLPQKCTHEYEFREFRKS